MILENLHDLVWSESPVKALRLQDELGKQSFRDDQEKLFEPVTKSIEAVS